LSQIVKSLVVVTGNAASVLKFVDPKTATTDPVSVMDESVNVDAFNHFVIVFAVPDPETPDPDGAAHVPSARKKFVVPPPDAGTNPFNADVNVFNSVVACVPVNVSTLPVAAVTRPKNEPVATCANIAFVTTLLAMVVVIAVAPDPVTSPDNVIVWFAVKYVGEKNSYAVFPAFLRNNCDAVPATAVTAPVPFPIKTPVNVDAPVPPLATDNCPAQPNVNETALINDPFGVPPNVNVTLVSSVFVKLPPEKYSNAVAPAFVRNNCDAVPNAVNPVPPLPTAIVDPFHVPDVIVPNVVMLADPAHVDNAVFSTLANPTSDFVTADHAGAAEIVPVPVCDKNCFVVVMFPAKRSTAAAP
jgi:hypothetical protein